MIRGIIKFVLRIVTLLLYRVKIVGQENIEKGKPYILCPNHISNWDPPTMVASLRRNDVYVLAKEEMFVNGFIKWLAVKVHALPVRRGKQDVKLLKDSVKVLKENHMILIFAEGTRNGIEKKGKIQNGAVLMSLMSGVPIIPIGIQSKTKYRPFTKVKINMGKPMDFSEYKDKKGDKETLDALSKQVMEKMIYLTNEEI